MANQSVEEVLASYPPFIERIDEEFRVSKECVETMQVNIGLRCNLACRHCYVSCSPARTELMDRTTMQACLDACVRGGFKTLDITGGAPEMNPDLEWFIEEADKRDIYTVVRTNLVILLEPEYEHFYQVYCDHYVHLFASLPYYTPGNCDKIRGKGVFDASIEVIQKLNSLGYGTGEYNLTFVFNPAGPTLPADTEELENEYRRNLKRDFDIEFTNLVVMNNMPCGRFAETLNRKDKLGLYMEKLINAFNKETIPTRMCRNQVAVDWQGNLADCDFNNAMGNRLLSGETIFDWVDREPEPRKISFCNWCYACTAGSGST